MRCSFYQDYLNGYPLACYGIRTVIVIFRLLENLVSTQTSHLNQLSQVYSNNHTRLLRLGLMLILINILEYPYPFHSKTKIHQYTIICRYLVLFTSAQCHIPRRYPTYNEKCSRYSQSHCKKDKTVSIKMTAYSENHRCILVEKYRSFEDNYRLTTHLVYDACFVRCNLKHHNTALWRTLCGYFYSHSSQSMRCQIQSSVNSPAH